MRDKEPFQTFRRPLHWVVAEIEGVFTCQITESITQIMPVAMEYKDKTAAFGFRSKLKHSVNDPACTAQIMPVAMEYNTG